MNDIQKKLKCVGADIELVHHRHAAQFRHMVESCLITLVMSENMCGQDSPAPDFMDSDSTSTFMECINVILHPDETIRLEVWEGDRKGHPAFLTYAYTFKGDWWRYQPLADAVNNAFRIYTLDMVSGLENQERENRRRALGERILKDLDLS